MTRIMLLLLRILALRLDQYRNSVVAATTSPVRSHLNTAALPPLTDHHRLWINTSLGPENNESLSGHRHVDTHLGPVDRLQKAAVEEARVLPSRVKKPLIGAHQHQIYSDVDAIAGRLVRLPCFVRPLGPSDSISLVLWYREDISGTPIYIVDARYGIHKAQHFVSKPYQDRQMMNFTLSPLEVDPETAGNSSSLSPSPTKPSSASTAHLYVMPVEESDAGLFLCRVDYRWERTTISIVTVNVIVPPRQLHIQLKPDSDYCRSDEACPLTANQTIILDEDSAVTLVCSSDGGKPFPLLNWYRNNELIRSEIFHSLTPNNRSLQSELHLTQIRPTEHNAVLKCLSSNDNQTFLSSQIRLKVNSKPSRVELLPLNTSTVLAGSHVSFICRSFGSRPAANHTWTIVPGEARHLPIDKHVVLLESQMEDHASHTQSTSSGDEMDEHNWDLAQVTESTVHLVLQPEDHGHRIVCRAENRLLRQGALEGSLKLNVTFAPKVTLQQLHISSGSSGTSRSSLVSGFATRGTELHLYCNVTANPSANSIVWYLNSQKLTEEDANDRQPIKITENSTHLIVLNVTEEWQGFYQCWANNLHGTGFSNQFQVQILYKPKCITPTQTIPANVGSLVTMICDVDANPTNVTFFWHSKHKDLRELSARTQLGLTNQHLQIKDRGMKSRLEIRIESGDDFGQYSCWSRNFAGAQEEPCYYNVYENTIKQQLLCESNISSRIIQVQCQPESALPSSPIPAEQANRSFDVSHQTTRSVLFNLKIFKHKRQLINITSAEPSFLVAVDELQQKEFEFNAVESAVSREMDDGEAEKSHVKSHVPTATNASSWDASTRTDQPMYMMLISSLTNGRLTSDVSLSFKVPVEPETNAIIKNKIDFDKDADFDEGAASSQNSQNLSTSRYKKIYPLNESQQPKDTSAASFTTAVTIKQLPLIWTVFLVTIFVLVVLILLTLIRLHRKRACKKPHVRFSRHHQEMPGSSDFVGNGLSSKEYLMEDETMVNEPGAEKIQAESIQLFTLANFDQTYAYSEHSPSRTELSRVKHIDMRAPLPDLMTGTLPVHDYENSQHNLYLYHSHKPSQAEGAMCHDLVSFGSAVVGAHCSVTLHEDRFQTLPNLRGRTSMRIPLPLDKDIATSLKRTPSVDGIELVRWPEADGEHVRGQCVQQEQVTHLQPFSVDMNSNQVP